MAPLLLRWTSSMPQSNPATVSSLRHSRALLAVMNISCFARWKLPTETKSLTITNGWFWATIIAYTIKWTHLLESWFWLFIRSQLCHQQICATAHPYTGTAARHRIHPLPLLSKDELALGSDSRRQDRGWLWLERPLCGRPRKPRPLITVSSNILFCVECVLLNSDSGLGSGLHELYRE